MQQIDPAEMAPGEFADAVRRSVEVDGAQVVIIDSLNGYLNAMPDERFLILQMHELLSYLSQRGVLTILVLAQHGLVGPMDTPLDISYLADGVLMLRYFEFDGSVRRALSVVKKRSGNHEHTIREFKLSNEGITGRTAAQGLQRHLQRHAGLQRGGGAPDASRRRWTRLRSPKGVVLILAPVGRDAATVAGLIERTGLRPVVCRRCSESGRESGADRRGRARGGGGALRQ